MEFALQYEIQRSRPHYDGFMYDIYHQATEQVKLADELGYHSVWTVEHHFLTEWSYSSAPEVWYGALSQVTKRIRLGHGVCLLPIKFNHPVRVAERIAVLDIMSNGRVECGTGRSITESELGGFDIDPEDSRPMWEEAIALLPKMWTQEVFEGHEGKYLKMPPREEAKAIAKDAIDFTTRKGAELFTPFANKEVKGYEFYKTMAQQAVAAADYRLSMEDLDKRIAAGAVMVGDPEDCIKVAKMYESAGTDLILMLVQVGAIPHEKVMQTIDLIAKHVMPK